MGATQEQQEIVVGATQEQEIPASPSLGLIAFIAGWPLCVLLAGGYFAKQYVSNAIEEGLASRPRIAVIDTDAMIAAQDSALPADERLKRGSKKINETVQRLRDASYLVIESHQVLSAPEATRVPTP